MLDKYFPIYILVFLTTLSLTVIIERHAIPLLTRVAKQPIYTDGPRWHMKKSGTPTMGGLAFVIASAIALLSASAVIGLVSLKSALSILLCLVYAISNSFIGIIDDRKKLKRKQNAGLKPKEKLILQITTAVLFLLLRKYVLDEGTTLSFSFGEVDIGFWYYPLSLFILVGIVNSANLTDGIDGLASSVAFGIGLSLLYLSMALSVETSVISTAIIGATIGFLIFNLHPAKIFMGDTGSLFLGALISSSAFTLNNPLLIIPIASFYAFEGLSVIIQVLVYKLTRKRVFKMAPFHHHLERCGWTENKICLIAIFTTLITSIPVYVFYLP